MKDISRGVQWYTVGNAVLKIHFPEDHVCCKYCKYLREGQLRSWCSLTGEVVYDVNFLDGSCPIETLEDKRE